MHVTESFMSTSETFISTIDIIKNYFDNFENLAKTQQWDEIISQGTRALEAAKHERRLQDEAKICAQLTSTAFYQGNYDQALGYVNRCRELAEILNDFPLLVRALYLESAVYRAFAGLEKEEFSQQAKFCQAVEITEKALQVYLEKHLNSANLKGKVYFNLGAAHADNPKGDLNQALDCYFKAIECFKNDHSAEDLIRTKIRIGKIHVLNKNFNECQKIVNEIRHQTTNERYLMQIDYLEAQLLLALEDPNSALKIARNGFERAKNLGAKEDKSRFEILLKTI